MIASALALAVDQTAALSSPITYLTGLGFPGVVISLLITGHLRTKSEVERLIEENRRKDEIIVAKDRQIEAMQTGIVEKAIPALTRSTQVLETLPHTEANIFDQLSSAQQQVAALASRLERFTDNSKG